MLSLNPASAINVSFVANDGISTQKQKQALAALLGHALNSQPSPSPLLYVAGGGLGDDDGRPSSKAAADEAIPIHVRALDSDGPAAADGEGCDGSSSLKLKIELVYGGANESSSSSSSCVAFIEFDGEFVDILTKCAATLSASSSSALTQLLAEDAALAAKAAEHPFVFVKVPSSSSAAASSSPELSADEKEVLAVSGALVSLTYQAIFSLNVVSVQKQLQKAVAAAGDGEGKKSTTSSVLVPFSEFGPALLLATRVCSCPGGGAAAVGVNGASSSSSVALCRGGCGNAPHDLVSRAYYNSDGAHHSNNKRKKKIVAVEIPVNGVYSSPSSPSASPSSSPHSSLVVAQERDYLFGVVHSGHNNNNNNSASSPQEDASPAVLSVAPADLSLGGGGSLNRSKGYALQSHIKGMNFIMRMATVGNLHSKSSSNMNGESAKAADAVAVLPAHAYHIGCASLATAALASRESSTHANQFVPKGGVGLVGPRALFDVRADAAACSPSSSSDPNATGSGGALQQFVLDPAYSPLSITRGGHTGISTGAASASANPLAQKALCFDVIGRLVEVEVSSNGEEEKEDAKKKKALSTLDFIRPFNSNNDHKGEDASLLRTIANTQFNTPIICISGTSAEAGKSTLAKKLLKALMATNRKAFFANLQKEREEKQGKMVNSSSSSPSSTSSSFSFASLEGKDTTSDAPLRVAYVKATGTSSWGDTIHAQRAGVPRTYDQLDSGLPTTYAKEDTNHSLLMLPSPSPQQGQGQQEEKSESVDATVPSALYVDQLAQLSLSFLHAQADGADVIVTELGGDIIFAKNPQLMAQHWFWSNTAKCLVICNDSMASIGVVHFLGVSGAVLFEGVFGDKKENEEESAAVDADADEARRAVAAGKEEKEAHAKAVSSLLFSSSSTASSSSPSPYERIVDAIIPFPLQFVASPFRTLDGAVSRANMLGMPAVMSPNLTHKEMIAYLEGRQ